MTEQEEKAYKTLKTDATAAPLAMLRIAAQLCREHNITYWLENDTLLGAARYKGFLFWDQGISIGILQDDYALFIDQLSDRIPDTMTLSERWDKASDVYAILTETIATKEKAVSSDASLSPSKKTIMTIIPAHKLSNYRLVQKIQQLLVCVIALSAIKRRGRPSLIHPIYQNLKSPLKRIIAYSASSIYRIIVAPFVPLKKLYRIVIRLSRLSSARKGATHLLKACYVYPFDVCIPTRPIAFEGQLYNAPNDIRACLSSRYGVDYMTSLRFEIKWLLRRENPHYKILKQRYVKTMLYMLYTVKKICDEHKLTYWLAYGTLLGAVRHKGLIPWDDDIDIEMIREDYEKLPNLLPKHLPDDLVLCTHHTDDQHPYLFAKVRYKHSQCITNDYAFKDMYKGICIDIFPVDKVPQKAYAQRLHVLLVRIAAKKRWRRSLYKWFIRQNKKLKSTSYGAGVGNRVLYQKTINDKRVYLPVKKMKFEGVDYSVPNDTDAYLSTLYGEDYMIPKKFNAHMDGVVFLKKASSGDYS